MRPTDPDTHTHLDANGTPYDHTHAPADAHLDGFPDYYTYTAGDLDSTGYSEAPACALTGRDVLHPRAGDVLG